VHDLERQAKDFRRRLHVQEERTRQRLLQAARAGQPVPPPAALDVTVEGEPGPAVERVAAALAAG